MLIIFGISYMYLPVYLYNRVCAYGNPLPLLLRLIIKIKSRFIGQCNAVLIYSPNNF